MNFLAIILVAILSAFSAGVMSYVAIATPLGPWIDPTIVLCVAILLKLLSTLGLSTPMTHRARLTVLIVAGSSVGGIIATAMGFAFPALYFLDPKLFCMWLSDPAYFCLVTSGLALVGSLTGLGIAHLLEEQMLFEERLLFPIGLLSYRMISAQSHWRKAKELGASFLGTLVFCWGQVNKLIPRYISIVSPRTFDILTIPWIRFDFFPIYWAIGFVSGQVVIIPLLVGALAKIFLVDPLHTLWFVDLSALEFMLAFGSGLMLAGSTSSLWEMPSKFWGMLKRNLAKFWLERVIFKNKSDRYTILNFLTILAVLPALIFFSYFKMSLLMLCYLFGLTFLCAYQVVYIAGKIGLAQLGRFATFVMLPALFLFPINLIHITFIAVFVELACGVAAEIFFGLKMAQLAGVPFSTVKRYQFFGIVISSIVIGLVFWALIHKFGLGSEELFAQRAQTRALLVNVTKFNPYAIALGICFGYLLKLVEVNPMLVLSGLLMPINVSLSMVFGGLLTFKLKHKEELYPFWSGVFAAHSLWMIVTALIG